MGGGREGARDEVVIVKKGEVKRNRRVQNKELDRVLILYLHLCSSLRPSLPPPYLLYARVETQSKDARLLLSLLPDSLPLLLRRGRKE